MRKKRWLNDNIKTPEPSLRVDMNNKENHPVKAVELEAAWSSANVQDIQHDHLCCFVAENDETDQSIFH